MSNMNQPILILPEGASRLLGKDAQRTNIQVAYAVASTVRSTLGPKGMDKMLVDEMGDIVITNDGATILQEMNVEHPVGKLLVEVAKTQDQETGDGTTTATILAGELLKEAGRLLDNNIHAGIIVNGYKQATRKATAILDEIAKPVTIKDTEILERIGRIAMGTKTGSSGVVGEKLSKMVVNAITQVAEERKGKIYIDSEFIKVEKKQGEGVENTSYIKGVVVDKEIVHPGMPKSVKDAKIALVDCALEIEKTETEAKINIESPEQLEAFLKKEEAMLKGMAEKIAATGATVLFCQKGIEDTAQHFLAKKGIVAARRVKKSDMDKLARATGAKVATSLDDLTKEDLGYAGNVEEKKIGGEQMIFVENCKNPKSVTIFVRGGTEHVVAEVERAITDCIGAVSSALVDGGYVIGGGATEVEIANRLRKYAIEIGGREQMAIQAFADALEIIPKTLAESAGMDPIDTLVTLRSTHEKGEVNKGVNVMGAKVEALDDVIEPRKVKRQAIASASEAAEMILRIDDMIASKGKPMAPPGGPSGMGGMGGME